MSQSSWRNQTLFKEWRWTHPETQVVAQARLRMQEIKAEVWGKKTALDWETYEEIPQGFAVQWTEGATKKVAHHWFWQRLFPEARLWKQGCKAKCCRSALFRRFRCCFRACRSYAAWVLSGTPLDFFGVWPWVVGFSNGPQWFPGKHLLTWPSSGLPRLLRTRNACARAAWRAGTPQGWWFADARPAHPGHEPLCGPPPAPVPSPPATASRRTRAACHRMDRLRPQRPWALRQSGQELRQDTTTSRPCLL